MAQRIVAAQFASFYKSEDRVIRDAEGGGGFFNRKGHALHVWRLKASVISWFLYIGHHISTNTILSESRTWGFIFTAPFFSFYMESHVLNHCMTILWIIVIDSMFIVVFYTIGS